MKRQGGELKEYEGEYMRVEEVEGVREIHA